ncbi:hypothetical protein A6U92_00965 [Agrobacterium rubi]|nr:hypothetical protein A6U92_00965 [Agrobacterium rubi]
MMTNAPSALPLIPVLVTGIQCDLVFGRERVIHGADAPWLNSCDEHRNEGEVCSTFQTERKA